MHTVCMQYVMHLAPHFSTETRQGAGGGRSSGRAKDLGGIGPLSQWPLALFYSII